ncbi:excinuclease ABC subunit UvrA [Adlercreutzia equolifaciens]|uniref:excinuclease ABC subunit UvrA n=1 Tax=Adlercreutzia rubneri TaxID=2916441 RepID=UPI001D061FDA|nr:excinuclease ABC subunit UvrA [Adlercreutzia rubneri]MCB6760504.1 excinuclease ABC subunit UvrA [Adlercreutzia equolifaciens]MCB6976235.1 excinuclease ABC subunit UvrA [Adlercreutzia equolifaciens]MDE8683045.1 excinuclease ABC subunit UvrA [Adlercreutzia rubneri]
MANEIVIKGAREHNLKDVDLTIPRDELVVITGLSGSGKSSLAFDTMYAEGQRRYVESLSSYARMFLGQMSKPDVDSIDGLSPAVSIDQKTTSKNPRSTVGTTTEIYDYLRLLFARVGVPHCPECGREIKKQTTDQVTDDILRLGDDAQGESTKAILMAPVVAGRKGEFTKLFADLQKEGFSRVRIDGEIVKLSGELVTLNKKIKHFIDVVVDRVTLKESAQSRIAEAVELACKLAQGRVLVQVLGPDGKPLGEAGGTSSGATGGLGEGEHLFSLALACPEHGHSMDELQPRDFSFNAPYGACPDCLGIGSRDEVDPSLVVPDPSLTLNEGVIAPFKSGNYYPQVLRAVAQHVGTDADTPWEDMPKKAQKALLHGLGNEKVRVDYRTVDGRDTYWYIEWEGVLAAVKRRYTEAQSDAQREKLSAYFATVPCETCGGKRLKPEVLAVTVNDKSIHDVTEMSAAESLAFFEGLHFTGQAAVIALPIVKEIRERLRFLVDVGLDYLTLERATATLSGGEAQRIRLATQIGAGLMGVLYILDEPSIGLHQRDNERLIATLERLRDLGNTVVVVEHDEDTIRAADFVVDMGPGAGEHGGHVIAAGTPTEVMATEGSVTADYLSGRRRIAVPEARRKPGRGTLKMTGAKENNLQNVTLEVPIGTLTVVTGVSGSGKSSLITDTLAPALANRLNHAHRRTGPYRKITGLEKLDKVINIDQSPIGRTPRSNPATYIGLWDDIRALFASTAEAKARGYAPGRFSFNVSGGRCEACKGDGQIKIEMHFLPDVYVPCEVCNGERYNRETLQVTYRGKNISEVLDMTVEDALHFFENIPGIRRKLQTLFDVGLGYIRLGQPATTLSGGEAQRVKLASELQKRQSGKTFYILDEPTTGLHFEDVRQLLEVLQRLVDAGNTVLVIEHNLDVIKCADHIVDLGPEGGDRGGTIVAQGTPEEVAEVEGSYTGHFVKRMLEADRQLASR